MIVRFGLTLLALCSIVEKSELLASALEQKALLDHHTSSSSPQVAFSKNVSSCPGYTLSELKETEAGLTARLLLAGSACNAFGHDIRDLTVSVAYESKTRLHVNIYDTAHHQFTVPTSIVTPPGLSSSFGQISSDLEFHYEPSPFAFWITRRGASKGSLPLFDTRPASLPRTPIPPIDPQEKRTALDGFSLVFEDVYLQLASVLPYNANVYGLGEIVASSGIRRDIGVNGKGTIQTNWARDEASPVDENIYGTHPFYIEHRYTSDPHPHSQTHGVFLNSAAGADILLLSPPGTGKSLIEYRLLGGTLDLYFFSGPSPQEVVEQYSQVVGQPTWMPLWAFGSQLCRWGYKTVNETWDVVKRMREANIPLEVMWNDIDLYHDFRDFTTDPNSFPGEEMRTFIRHLHSQDQRYIPILDAGIPVPLNETDHYLPYETGKKLDVFMKNPNGSIYIGEVWPGYTAFPDWFNPNTEDWWTEAILNWTKAGVEFDGLWVDMNEVSSFCDGSCGSGKVFISNNDAPLASSEETSNLTLGLPKYYDYAGSGFSGDTIGNKTTTDDDFSFAQLNLRKGEHDLDTLSEDIDINAPPYAIKNAIGRLGNHAAATNATHYHGYIELDTHNIWGVMEERATYASLLKIKPGERPFMMSRSTYAGAGKFTGHWLGDNISIWPYLHYSIQGILQFQLFQIPMVGADACGFQRNTTEELCNRWMQLAAFTPFMRNHNINDTISQEPFVWPSVAEASRVAIRERYRLLPYWYSLFANASLHGTPPVRPLFFEFPHEPKLFRVDRQFLIGRDILVTPVLSKGATSVTGFLPGHEQTVWRDWYTHRAMKPDEDTGTATFPAPLGHINVHIRDGAAILLHQKPGYTTTETAEGPYELLVSLTAEGYAHGHAYIDDGIIYPANLSRTYKFFAHKGKLTITSKGEFRVSPKLEKITILGVITKPTKVNIDGQAVSFEYDITIQQVELEKTGIDLNKPVGIEWY